MPAQILSTKLSIPPLRSRLVARPQLINKLNLGSECGFVLVSAPAGYGKSTLLSAWLGQAKLATAWLSLDDGDNDPGRFLAYLAAALQGIDPALDEALEIPPRTSPLPEVEILLTPWVNHLSQVDRPFCLVLDDYHLIQNQLVHQVVSFLLEHRPAPLHLVISTRADPPLPLARLRASAGLTEIRGRDLRFSVEESDRFLNQVMDLDLTGEQVAALERRTEGWIAGLQLAALSMHGREDLQGFVSALTGSNHYIVDYLVEEVLGRQPEALRQFLLMTSILERLTGSLCDALTGEETGAEVLERLDRANLFAIPLDDEHRWYRYHHLFSDLLRQMLEQTYPGLSVKLHQRACRWFEGHNLLPEALEHAISSGDMELVTRIVSANALVLIENDEMALLLQKIDSIPTDQLISLPWLGIARAWALGTRQVNKSHQILDTVEKNLENTSDSAEHQRLKSHLTAARAFLFSLQGNPSEAIAHAKVANELLPLDEIAVRAMNLTIWGDIRLEDRRHDPSAIPILEQALSLALQARKPHVSMIAAAALASAYLHVGRLHEVHRVCLEALKTADEYQRLYHQPLSATANVYSLLARVLVEWGENEKAIEFARKGLALSERWGQADTEMHSLNYLGRALVYGNYMEEARQVFQRAHSTAQKISPWFQEITIIFTLDSILDSLTPGAGEIADEIRRLQESGARHTQILQARLSLRDNRPDDALEALEKRESYLTGQPAFDTVRIYALRALAFQAKGDEKQALAALQQALELAIPENRVMTFVREGASMESLLRLARVKGITPQFVQHLLAAFESRRKHKPGTPVVTETLVEPLSARELEVLNLLAQGCADKQIAEKLVISRQTVHKHLKNIYEKLDVHSRTEAVARGHQLNVL